MKKPQKKSVPKKIAKKVVTSSKPASVMPATPQAPKIPAFKVQPIADRVIIKEDTESKEQTTASGIIIPISAQEDKGSKRGKIVAVGNGRVEEGKTIPLSVKVGETVLFQWGDKIKVDTEDYYIVRESEILAILN
jgi:chaperonin GroES